MDFNGICSKECQFNANRTSAHLMHHIRNGIATRLTFADMHLLPKRRDFLDPVQIKRTDVVLSRGKPLLVMPNQVLEKPEYVDGEMQLVIWIFGIVPSGQKVAMRMTEIPIHYDVFVPDGSTPQTFQDSQAKDLANRGVAYERTEIINLMRFQGFHTQPSPVLRVWFKTLSERKKYCEYIAECNQNRVSKYVTASDDQGRKDFYFAKFARDGRLNSADWNVVTGWTTDEALRAKTTADITITVPAHGVVALSDTQRRRIADTDQAYSELLTKDNTICVSWDIETYRTIQNGQVPRPGDKDYVIFMMNQTYSFHHSTDCFYDFSAVSVESDAHPDQRVIMVCNGETEVLRAHMGVIERMQPDISGAFNGSNFDWPLYRDKCQRAGLSNALRKAYSCFIDRQPPDDPLKWCFTSERVKIDAETTQELPCVAMFTGCIDLDMQPIFKKMYPRGEVGRGPGSLNFYLAKNKLGSKEDMPYKRMFRVYERLAVFAKRTAHVCHCDARCDLCAEVVPELDLKESKDPSGEYTYGPESIAGPGCCVCDKYPRAKRDMALVSQYCRTDCIKPMQLMALRMIIRDKRALSNMSYVCLRDSIFRADGMKVRNKIGHEATIMGYGFSNRPSGKQNSEKDHYPGAYVIPPKRGLNTEDPITGLDFASLYPSIKMAYNATPDRVVSDIEQARALRRAGYLLHYIPRFTFERGEKKGDAVNAKLTAEGWFVRHRGVITSADTKTTVGYDCVVTYTRGSTVVTYIEKSIREINRDYAAMTDAELDGWLRSHEHFEITYQMPVAEMVDKLAAAGGFVLDLGADNWFIRQYRFELAAKAAGWIRSVKRVPVYGGAPLPGERMGLFPTIVKDLFDKRVPVKDQFTKYSKLEESFEKAEAAGELHHGDTMTVDGESITLDEIKFRKNCADATQRGLKVLANTFYGESGNFRSSVYTLLVAAGITLSGQLSLKSVYAFVTSLGFKVHYGDTDSLYLSPPDSLFIDFRREYHEQLTARFDTIDEPTCARVDLAAFVAIRTDYWTKKVETTMTCVNVLAEQVFDFLIARQGTLFLKMAYEEVCFPTALCGKKKYFATEHKGVVNFSAPSPFIRGIDIIKQGQTPIAIELGMEFMNEARSVSNVKTLLTLAEEKIRKFYEMPLDAAKFAQMAKYNPAKKNVPVLRFVERMKALYESCRDPTLRALYEPPEAGDKFKFVVVQKPQEYEINGKIIKLGAGDKREYLRVFNHCAGGSSPMMIDRGHYAKSSIVGLFGRFIAGDPKFQPAGYDLSNMSDEIYKLVDEESCKAACSYLETLCDQYEGNDRAAVRLIGQQKRKEYNAAAKRVYAMTADRFGESLADFVASSDRVDDFLTCSELVPYDAATIARDVVDKIGGNPHVAHRLYNRERLGLVAVRRTWCHAEQARMQVRLRDLADQLRAIRRKYSLNLASVMESGSADLFTDDEEQTLHDVAEMRRQWAAIYNVDQQAKALGEAIATMHTAALDSVGAAPPVVLTGSEISAEVAAIVAAARDHDYHNWY